MALSKRVVCLSWLIFCAVAVAATAGHGLMKNTEEQSEEKANARVVRSDDTVLGLEAVVQQQAQTILSLQTHLTAMETKFQDLQDNKIQGLEAQLTASNARVHALETRLPAAFSKVAFTVHFSHDGNDGIALGNHQVLQFDRVTANIGNGYNRQTGIFTAPVAGVYSFFLSLMGTNTHGAVALAIDRHGAVLDLVWAEGQGDHYDQGSGQAVTHLDAGEQVWVRQDGGDAVRGSWYTVFTGYLVQAD